MSKLEQPVTRPGAVALPALRRAIEGRDGAALAAFYADDALLRIIDHAHPPSQAQELRGRESISRYLDDICGRAMTHRLENAVAVGDRMAFTEVCRYPDGKQVYAATTLELENGRIARHIMVQAWDS